MDNTVKINPDDFFRAAAIVLKTQREEGVQIDLTNGDVARMVFIKHEIKAGRISG